MKILTEATPMALWYEAVHQAQERSRIILKTEIESYLVFLLSRYLNQPEFIKDAVALKFLEAMKLQSSQRNLALQAVGDKCLLITGLFPRLAERKRLKLSYFINVGQVAYEVVSDRNNDLFCKLSKHFVVMMDVLQSCREQADNLLPAEAFALWEDTGSQRAYKMLQEYHLTPIRLEKWRKR